MNICIAVYFCHFLGENFCRRFSVLSQHCFYVLDFCLRVPRLRVLHAAAICAPPGGSMENSNYEKQNSGENSGFFKKLMKDPNYDKFYRIFKKLPKILAIVVAILVFIWSIVDVAVFSYDGYYDTYYGVMRLGSCFLVLLIWWLIGAVSALLTYFFSALPVAATVVRTDAVLELNAKVKETPAETQQND